MPNSGNLKTVSRSASMRSMSVEKRAGEGRVKRESEQAAKKKKKKKPTIDGGDYKSSTDRLGGGGEFMIGHYGRALRFLGGQGDPSEQNKKDSKSKTLLTALNLGTTKIEERKKKWSGDKEKQRIFSPLHPGGKNRSVTRLPLSERQKGGGRAEFFIGWHDRN